MSEQDPIERAVKAVGLRYDHENRLIANRVLRALAENAPVVVLPGGEVRGAQTVKGIVAFKVAQETGAEIYRLTDEEGA